MLSKEEIKKAKAFMVFYKNYCLNKETANMEIYETVNDEGFVYKNIETILQYLTQLESDKQKLIDKLEEKQKEIDDLNQFYETYEINYEGQAVLIDRNKFKEVIGADKGFSILVVNALPSIEEN